MIKLACMHVLGPCGLLLACISLSSFWRAQSRPQACRTGCVWSAICRQARDAGALRWLLAHILRTFQQRRTEARGSVLQLWSSVMMLSACVARMQASEGQLPHLRLSKAQAAALHDDLERPHAALKALGCSTGVSLAHARLQRAQVLLGCHCYAIK